MPSDIDIPAQIEKQIDYLLRTRAVFPAIDESAVGHSSFPTAPYYQQAGIHIKFWFAEPITLNQVQTINSIGHWMNQNFAIRLCALLEYHGVIPTQSQGKLNKSLPGFQDVNIVRRLRNVLTHTSGRYNTSDAEERRLYETMVTHYRVEGADSATATEFPLSIDAVLVPMARGCQEYAQTWENEQAGQQARKADSLRSQVTCKTFPVFHLSFLMLGPLKTSATALDQRFTTVLQGAACRRRLLPATTLP